ncbi:23S ribosomal RNA methyltransferase Erm [Natronoglycomyces albus]|uniref:23S ribosomal RNA methyltransferase Erm n=1 Tax=Natronoglycomyces albus TaxID=2811108 RepID=A0A895XJE9_9ACTN|nr:23S ribosomal RNA methyltransferase Erm [Natronoglycomyces albus]QSB05464.1 23S ribosomal RNA methyltransferase Erm [Natronoglycomyces albus]
MPSSLPGRHELGQNFLIDPQAVKTILTSVAATDGPIIEIGPGGGALTFGLERLNRHITAVEIDPHYARRLRARVADNTNILTGDFLSYRLPPFPHVIVGNLPFHQTTAILRRLLNAPDWTDAVLVAQWEVARRRAGVGGATMMTAQWWPWFDFELITRLPARSFRPMPNVDGGLFTMSRRETPLLCRSRRQQYHAFVRRIFTGRGLGLPQIVSHANRTGKRTSPSTREVSRWMAHAGVRQRTLPKDLTAHQWVELFQLCGESGPTPTSSTTSTPNRHRKAQTQSRTEREPEDRKTGRPRTSHTSRPRKARGKPGR